MEYSTGNTEEFDLPKFQEEFSTALTHAAAYLYTRVRADEVRYCVWDGQNDDGRKHTADIGHAPFPWEGCADTRVRFVDDCVNENVDIVMNALKRSSMQVTPLGDSSELPEATLHTKILDWMINNKMNEEWDRSWEMLFQWANTYGAACMAVYWRRETDLETVTVTMQDVLMVAQQDQNLQDILSKVMGQEEPTDEDWKVLDAIFQVYFPGEKTKKSVNDLRRKGFFEYEREYLRTNRPTIMPLRILEDIFFPINTYAIQEARWVVRRDILSIPEVRDRARLEKWDDDFTEKLIETKGHSVLATTYYNTWRTRITQNVFIDDVYGMIEVFYAYSKEVDEAGKRRMYETVFHPTITKSENNEGYGKREIFAYDHGKFPFVEFPRERLTRSLLESRGIPELMGHIQNEIKVQRDSRVDRTSIGTLPPLKVPLGRGRMQVQMGPATQIPVGPSGDVGWLEPPPMDNTTLEIEKSLILDTKSYLGQYNDQLDPNKIIMRQQRMVDKSFVGVKEVGTQIYQLLQQYLDDDTFAKITKQLGLSIHAGREAIQGEFDLSMAFDVRDLNMEYLKSKLEAIMTLVAPNDTAGNLDRAYLTRYATTAIDPTLAREAIKPSGQVTQQEIEDEKNNLAQIASGIEPPMIPQGQNYQLRLQVIQNTLQTSPSLQREISSDPDKQKLLQNRIKFLTFQIQQQQNANIGRVGTSPIQGL